MTRKGNIATKIQKALVIALSCVIAFSAFSAVSLSADIVQADSNNYELKVSGFYEYELAYDVLSLVNKERKANNLSSLKIDSTLTEAAMLRAAELSVSYSHTRPNGTSATTVTSGVLAENIQSGSYTVYWVFTGGFSPSENV